MRYNNNTTIKAVDIAFLLIAHSFVVSLPFLFFLFFSSSFFLPLSFFHFPCSPSLLFYRFQSVHLFLYYRICIWCLVYGRQLGRLVVVMFGLTQVFKGKNRATLPTSTGFVNLNSHPVRLVVTLTFLLASASHITVVEVTWNLVWVSHGTGALSNWSLHVVHVNTLSLTQHLESLQTGGLVQLGWDGSGLSTRTNQRRIRTSNLRQLGSGFGLDLVGLEGDSGDGEKPGLSSSTCKGSRKPVC